MLLPYVLLANRPAIADAARLARYLNSTKRASTACWRGSSNCARIGIPANLAALGLDGEDAQWVGEQALADLSSRRPTPCRSMPGIMRASTARRWPGLA